MINTAKILSTFFYFWLIWVNISCSQASQSEEAFADSAKSDRIIVAADRVNDYFSFLKGKTIAIVANQTSQIGDRHLVDEEFNFDVAERGLECCGRVRHGYSFGNGSIVRAMRTCERAFALRVVSHHSQSLGSTR